MLKVVLVHRLLDAHSPLAATAAPLAELNKLVVETVSSVVPAVLLVEVDHLAVEAARSSLVEAAARLGEVDRLLVDAHWSSVAAAAQLQASTSFFDLPVDVVAFVVPMVAQPVNAGLLVPVLVVD